MGKHIRRTLRLVYVASIVLLVLFAASTLILVSDLKAQPSSSRPCQGLPSHAQLTTALTNVVTAGGNGGLGNDMWATIVDRDGVVCAVTKTGDPGDQWPGSRVISARLGYRPAFCMLILV